MESASLPKPLQVESTIFSTILQLAYYQQFTVVEAAGVEPASENVTGQETTCLFRFMPWALPQDVRDGCSERTRNSRR